MLIHLVLFLSLGAPQSPGSNPPAPSGGKPDQHGQQKPSAHRDKATTNTYLLEGSIWNLNGGTSAETNTNHDKNHSDEKPPSHWWVDPNWWVAGFTCLLVLVAIGQAILFVCQLVLFRRGLVDSTKAANAAAQNAQALINAERPWLMVKTVTKRWDDRTKIPTFDLKVFNHGKSPAHVLSLLGPTLDFFQVPENELPVPPRYGEEDSQQRFVGPRHDSVPFFTVDTELTQFRIGKRRYEAVRQITNSIAVVYGLIKYGDGSSKTIYETAFCYKLDLDDREDESRYSLVECGPKEYNRYT